MTTWRRRIYDQLPDPLRGPVRRTWESRTLVRSNGTPGVPGDLAGIFWSWGLKQLHVPPFGLLELDLHAGFILAGALGIPSVGPDPIGSAQFYAYPHPSLRNRTLYVQSLTLGILGNRPLLTNHSSALIR